MFYDYTANDGQKATGSLEEFRIAFIESRHYDFVRSGMTSDVDGSIEYFLNEHINGTIDQGNKAIATEYIKTKAL